MCYSSNLDGNKNFIRWLNKYLSESKNTAVKMDAKPLNKSFSWNVRVEKNNGISVWVCVTFKQVPIVINYYNRHVIISHISLQILYVVILSQRFLFFFLFNLDIGKMRKCLFSEVTLCSILYAIFFMPKWGYLNTRIHNGLNQLFWRDTTLMRAFMESEKQLEGNTKGQIVQSWTTFTYHQT